MKNKQNDTGAHVIQETIVGLMSRSTLVEASRGGVRQALLAGLIDALSGGHPVGRVLFVASTEDLAAVPREGSAGGWLQRNGADPGTSIVVGSIDAVATGVAGHLLDTTMFDRLVIVGLDAMAGAADAVLVRRALGPQRDSRIVVAIAGKAGPAHRTLMRDLAGQFEEVTLQDMPESAPVKEKKTGAGAKGTNQGRGKDGPTEGRSGSGSGSTYDGRNIRGIQDSIAAITGGRLSGGTHQAVQPDPSPGPSGRTGRRGTRNARSAAASGSASTGAAASGTSASAGSPGSGKKGKGARRKNGTGRKAPPVQAMADTRGSDPYSMTTEERLKLYRERYGSDTGPQGKKPAGRGAGKDAQSAKAGSRRKNRKQEKTGIADRDPGSRASGGSGDASRPGGSGQTGGRAQGSAGATGQGRPTHSSATGSGAAGDQGQSGGAGTGTPKASIFAALRGLGLFRTKRTDKD